MARAATDALTEAHIAALKWHSQLLATNNESFFPLYFDQHRYMVLMGGGGSGKSIFAGRKVLERVTSEPGHRWLVCRKVAKTLRESCFQQLIGQLSDHYPDSGYKANRSDLVISLANGSEILFAGLDDVEKLKSIYNITGIWIEEASELLEGDFNQLDIRLRGETKYYKQIILSFNPVNIMHWLKHRFFDKRDDNAITHHSTYKDNKFLDAESVRVLESFKDTDEYYYAVYCLGQWGVTGKTVFDAAAVTHRLADDIKPEATGYFLYDDDGLKLSSIKWFNDPKGFIRIYTQPKDGYPYVIGGDTAGDGSDYFTGQVLDNTTGKQVAVLRQQKIAEDEYARQMYCLGLYYNKALLGIETNFSTFPVRELERLKYPKQYARETLDDYTHKIKHSFGFLTTEKTRNTSIAGLIKAAREDISMIQDADTLTEMLTFVRNEDFRPEAEQGAHDDCIMALAIAHYIRGQQVMYVTPPPSDKKRWSKTMHEDYDRASREERKMLIKEWGVPER